MQIVPTLKKFGASPHDYDLFGKLQAAHNCRKSNNMEWLNRHEDKMYALLEHFLPHGSGINSKWQYGFDRADIITCGNSFHVMNEDGYYTHWIDFSVTIYPSMEIRIKGGFGKHQDISEYLHEAIGQGLSELNAIHQMLRIYSYYREEYSELTEYLTTPK